MSLTVAGFSDKLPVLLEAGDRKNGWYTTPERIDPLRNQLVVMVELANLHDAEWLI